jgi:hypothetical protein
VLRKKRVKIFVKFYSGQSNWAKIVHALLRAKYNSDLNVESRHNPVYRDHDTACEIARSGSSARPKAQKRWISHREKSFGAIHGGDRVIVLARI